MPAGDASSAVKRCNGCGEDKPLVDFTADARKSSGRGSRCKVCKATAHREYHRVNAEIVHAKRKLPEARAKARRYLKNSYDRRRDWIDSFKASKPCVDCGECFPPCVLEFDHIRGEKRFAIGSWINSTVRATEDEVRAEMAKCELRCANCHRIRHSEQLRLTWGRGEPEDDGQIALEM